MQRGIAAVREYLVDATARHHIAAQNNGQIGSANVSRHLPGIAAAQLIRTAMDKRKFDSEGAIQAV
jgi:hypothetical protein